MTVLLGRRSCRGARARTLASTFGLGRLQINGVGFLSYADFRVRMFSRSGLHWLVLPAASCMFLAEFAAAANFTLEQVMASPFPSNLVAASHSPRVAWVFDAKGVRNIWVADAPDFAARQVTHYEGDEGLPLASLRITAGRPHPGVRPRQRDQRKRASCRPHERGLGAQAAGVGRRCGRRGSPPAGRNGLRRRRTAKTSNFRPTGNSRYGRRESSCGLRPFPGRPRRISSPIFAATMRIHDGLPTDARSLWSASAAITASSPSIDFGRESRSLSFSQRRSRQHAALVAGRAAHRFRPAALAFRRRSR